MEVEASQQDIIKELTSRQLPVVICGAGTVGKVLLSFCEQHGIKVECFCDSSIKLANSKFCGLDVVYTPDLKNRHKDAIILISVAAIQDVVKLLTSMGYSNWYAGGLLLKDFDVTQEQAQSMELDYTKFAVENCMICHEGYMHPDRLFIRSIDLIITEKCSLRCRDCSNLTAYYSNPQELELDMLMRSIDAFCAVVDEIMEFRILGGDALMSRQWPSIVARLTAEPKTRRVVMYTNGTLLPKQRDMACLQNSKVLVVISDYGKLSRKLSELKSMLEHNKIAYRVLEVNEWLDCAAVKPHTRGERGNREIFRLCCAKNMATLSSGRLFRCPYAANAHRLQAVPDFDTDYVDLFAEPLDPQGIDQTRAKVRNFLVHTDFLKTCDFCNGRPLSGKEVEPAVQVANPLPYTRYLSRSDDTQPHAKQ